jgi:hypothetical protein
MDALRNSGKLEGTRQDALRSSRGAIGVEFTVERHEFNRAVKFLLAGTSRAEQARLEFVDLNATPDQIELVTTGTSSACPAIVSRAGYARIPLGMFERISRSIRTLRIEQIQVLIEPGAMRIGTLAFSHPEISLRLIGSRIADLPIDAPLSEVLAVSTQFRPEEIEDSGLVARILAAQEEASRMVDQAFKTLEPLGIKRADLSEFVSQQIVKHARRQL